MTSNHIKLWEDCLRQIEDNITPEQFKSWFEPITSISFGEGKLNLMVPSPYFVEHIEAKFGDLLGKVICRVYGSGTQLFYNYHQINNE